MPLGWAPLAVVEGQEAPGDVQSGTAQERGLSQGSRLEERSVRVGGRHLAQASGASCSREWGMGIQRKAEAQGNHKAKAVDVARHHSHLWTVVPRQQKGWPGPALTGLVAFPHPGAAFPRAEWVTRRDTTGEWGAVPEAGDRGERTDVPTREC